MKKHNRLISMVLCLILLLSTCSFVVFAADETLGVVKVSAESTLNVRSGAGTAFSKIASLANGTIVIVTASEKADDNALWYKIQFNDNNTDMTGYVHSDYLTLVKYSTDDEFNKYLDEQGFPQEYKTRLNLLHAVNPKWIFVAQNIGKTWDEALTAECSLGTSMVARSSLDSWKSFEKGAYNWSNKTWYGLDGNSWVAASPQIIAYYMDPRNFLTDTSIFQFASLKYNVADGVNLDSIKKVFAPSFLSGSYQLDEKEVTYVDTVAEAAKFSGANPYMLAARLLQEQGINGNALAHGTVSGYEGYYNFFNHRAYATSQYTAMQYGAMYAAGTSETYLRPWDTPYKSILGGAKMIANGFINRGQDTLYLQKFDMVDGGDGYYNHQYMTNIQAASSEAVSLKKSYSEEALAGSIVFNIPVYANMPEQPCVKPVSTGDNNNWLSSLTVENHTLTPEYVLYTTNYDLIVDANVSEITVKATAYGAKATITGAGKATLAHGDNEITITVAAASGIERKYKLSVFRKGTATDATPSITPSATPTPTPSPTPSPTPTPKLPEFSGYSAANGLINDVKEGTTTAQMITKLNVLNGSVKVKGADNSEKTGTALTATGDTVQIYNTAGTLFAEYKVVVYGDVNGDGKVTTLDILRAQKHILKMITLNGCYLEACDVNHDKNVTSLDLLRCQKHVLKLLTL